MNRIQKISHFSKKFLIQVRLECDQRHIVVLPQPIGQVPSHLGTQLNFPPKPLFPFFGME